VLNQTCVNGLIFPRSTNSFLREGMLHPFTLAFWQQYHAVTQSCVQQKVMRCCYNMPSSETEQGANTKHKGSRLQHKTRHYVHWSVDHFTSGFRKTKRQSHRAAAAVQISCLPVYTYNHAYIFDISPPFMHLSLHIHLTLHSNKATMFSCFTSERSYKHTCNASYTDSNMLRKMTTTCLDYCYTVVLIL